MMLGFGNQHSRICVLESSFKEFQKTIDNHINSVDIANKELRQSHKEIIAHIDKAQKENLNASYAIKDEIIEMMEKDYYSKVDVEKQMTEMRSSIVASVASEKASTLKDIRVGVLIVIATLSMCGWWYVNVAIPAATHHAANGVKTK